MMDNPGDINSISEGKRAKLEKLINPIAMLRSGLGEMAREGQRFLNSKRPENY